MSVLKVKNGNQWDIVPAIKGDPGDPAADESITDDMLVTDGIKTEIEWLWGNQLTDSREGEFLHAEEAYTSPAVDISVDGKSTQVTTTGKNLLDESNNIVRGYFYDSNDKIEGGGTSIYAPVTEGATYTLSGGNGNRYVVAYTDVLPAVNAPLIAHASAQKTFTVPTGARYVVFYIDNGNTLTPSGYQLEAGSSATAYEPYTGGKPSPNPDYQQEIVSVDEPSLNVTGINLLNTAEWLENRFISAKGRVTTSSDAHYTPNYSPVSEGALTLIMPRLSGATNTVRLHGYDEDKQWAKQIYTAVLNAGTSTFAANVTISADIKYVRLSSSKGAEEYLLEYGSTATSYEPYLGNTASLLPDGYSLRSLPDGTKDELHLSYLRPSTREGWAWYSRELVQRVGSLLFPEISWTYREAGVDSTGQAQSRFTCRLNAFGLAAAIRPKNSFCSAYAVQNTSGDRNTIFGDGTIYQLTNYASLYQDGVNDSRFNNVADFLAANENTVIMAALITPTTETLDPIELPIMPSQTVNVWSDPATNLKMTYIQDSNLIIENLEATIADIATS